VPPVAALLGFGFLVVSRPNFGREVLLASVVGAMGCLVFVGRRVVRT